MFSSERNLKGKVVVVTGAGAGLGRAISHAFARRGAHLGIISRNEKRLLSLKEELNTFNSKVVTAPLDV